MAQKRALAVLCSTLLLGAVAGCDRSEPITSLNTPKDRTIQQQDTQPQQPADTGVPAWTVPDGWKQLPGNDMRFATLQVADDPTLQLTVIPLAGRSGGLEANVNRWREQIGLPKLAEGEVKASVEHRDVGPLHIDVVDLVGPQARMLGAVIERSERTWYFKMSGPTEKIAAQKSRFDAFIGSLKFVASDQANVPTGNVSDKTNPHGNMNVTPATQPSTPAASGGPTWTAPQGWTSDPTPRSGRVATYLVGEGDAKAEMAIMQFPVDSFMADVAGNINRWRGQIGLANVPNPQETNPPQAVTIGGVAGYVFDMTNPEQKKRMRIALVQQDQVIWYFKLTGPEATVAAQQKAYESLLSSVKLK